METWNSLLFCWSTWFSLMHFGRPCSLRTRRFAKKPTHHLDRFLNGKRQTPESSRLTPDHLILRGTYSPSGSLTVVAAKSMPSCSLKVMGLGSSETRALQREGTGGRWGSSNKKGGKYHVNPQETHPTLIIQNCKYKEMKKHDD